MEISEQKIKNIIGFTMGRFKGQTLANPISFSTCIIEASAVLDCLGLLLEGENPSEALTKEYNKQLLYLSIKATELRFSILADMSMDAEVMSFNINDPQVSIKTSFNVSELSSLGKGPSGILTKADVCKLIDQRKAAHLNMSNNENLTTQEQQKHA